jgi:hypothetical protein
MVLRRLWRCPKFPELIPASCKAPEEQEIKYAG